MCQGKDWFGCGLKKTPISFAAVKQLSNQLRVAGCSVDRHAFKAHVTLFRNLCPAGLIGFDPINWTAIDVVAG